MDCGPNDAPPSVSGYACDEAGTPICTWDGAQSQVLCSLASCSLTGNNDATSVHDYGQANVPEFSTWGECGGVTFCCLIKDYGGGAGQEVKRFLLRGNHGVNYLDFEYGGGTRQMDVHYAGGTLDARIEGRGGDDVISGSYALLAGGYREQLQGGNGADVIYGNGGSEIIRGGAGVDRMYGGNGNDRLDGGDGADEIYGGDGDDTYCDTSEDSAGNCTSNTFAEGPYGGDDTFWLQYSAQCDPAGNLDAASDAGSGNDACGPATNAWGSLPWAGCDVDIDAEPATCP